MNRRKFCLASVAATISGAAAGQTASLTPSAPARGVSTPGIPLYRFIYDRRFSAGLAFGAAAERARSIAGTTAIDGDITALWSRDLRLRRPHEDSAIAGMTTARTLFCLEQLARDLWMRVVIRADHATSGGSEIVHRLSGSQAMVARFTPLLAAADWPAKMPAALASCSVMTVGGADHVTCVLGSPYGRRAGEADDNLVSFVIA
jgi:hypothetical protein